MTRRQQTRLKSSKQRLSVRPRSVTGLLLASFALVALPLLVSTLFGAFYVNRLANQSQDLVVRGVQAARAGKRLNTIITDMERSARQYKILGEPILATRFSAHKKAFVKTLQRLHRLHRSNMAPWHLDTLRKQVKMIAAAVKTGPDAIDDELALFDAMHKETVRISRQIEQFIDNRLDQLQHNTRQAHYFLLLCAILLIPGVVLLAIIFTALISRPVRHVNKAIARLGEGDFDHPVQVAAPSAEFDVLAGRLDWMRQRLGTLEKERNQFLRHMSHELKTPLTSIREGAELLRDGTVGNLKPEQAEVAAIIQRNSLELLRLIENLLDFSAWQQQQIKLEYSYFEIRALAEDVVHRQKLTIDSKHLSVLLPEQPTSVTADRERIHLIIDNLLTNAVKFSPDRGTIRIDTGQDGNKTFISVSDEGPGINPQDEERLFEAFFQGSHAANTAMRGTGVGLSVVSECVSAHGGQIDIRDAPGGGACFMITLPNEGNPPDGHQTD